MLHRHPGTWLSGTLLRAKWHTLMVTRPATGPLHRILPLGTSKPRPRTPPGVL